mmetsp:Transcript_14950/g.37560  ORF Transcript_14950/g.37560 Transcript_14950/m.37560 type:complete len:290 (-) Transcript_14950:324-1193(-)
MSASAATTSKLPAAAAAIERRETPPCTAGRHAAAAEVWMGFVDVAASFSESISATALGGRGLAAGDDGTAAGVDATETPSRGDPASKVTGDKSASGTAGEGGSRLRSWCSSSVSLTSPCASAGSALAGDGSCESAGTSTSTPAGHSSLMPSDEFASESLPSACASCDSSSVRDTPRASTSTSAFTSSAFRRGIRDSVSLSAKAGSGGGVTSRAAAMLAIICSTSSEKSPTSPPGRIAGARGILDFRRALSSGLVTADSSAAGGRVGWHGSAAGPTAPASVGATTKSAAG